MHFWYISYCFIAVSEVSKYGIRTTAYPNDTRDLLAKAIKRITIILKMCIVENTKIFPFLTSLYA